jgi:hypothetical protein
VLANKWSQQVVFLSEGDLTVRANVTSPIAWKPLSTDERPGRARLRPPRGGGPILVCGTDHVLLAHSMLAPLPPGARTFPPPRPAPPPPRVTQARWDFYTYDGELRYTIEDSLPNLGPDSVLFTIPAALVGDRLFTYSNTLRGFPAVREYRVHFREARTAALGRQ